MIPLLLWSSIICLFVCVATCHTMPVDSEAGFRAALQAPDVSVIQLITTIRLTDEAWIGQIVLKRNVTVTNAPSRDASLLPVLDVNSLAARLRLDAGVHLTIRGIYLRQYTFVPGTIWSTPGLSILAPSQLAPTALEAAKPRVVLKDAGFFLYACASYELVSCMLLVMLKQLVTPYSQAPEPAVTPSPAPTVRLGACIKRQALKHLLLQQSSS